MSRGEWSGAEQQRKLVNLFFAFAKSGWTRLVNDVQDDERLPKKYSSLHRVAPSGAEGNGVAKRNDATSQTCLFAVDGCGTLGSILLSRSLIDSNVAQWIQDDLLGSNAATCDNEVTKNKPDEL